MAIAQQLAGYTLGGADLLRRAMGKKKKEILDTEYENFSTGMTRNGYSRQATHTLWEVMAPFAGYAFNKSHTAGYGLISYWTAYLKANFPAEYMAALLTSMGGDKDRSAVYLAECRTMGITVLPPDVNESALTFTPTGGDIRFGLGAVRNVGAAVVESIISSRAGSPYSGFADFLSRSDIAVCNKRTVESLIKAGAFDSLGHTRRGLDQVHAHAVDAVLGLKRAQARGQFDLFADPDAEDGPGGPAQPPRVGPGDQPPGVAADIAAGLRARDARALRLQSSPRRRRTRAGADRGLLDRAALRRRSPGRSDGGHRRHDRRAAPPRHQGRQTVGHREH